ncbi:translocation/assembly module TamB domain-containing protein [Ahrensia sp. R2A130]|uniref:translocation/assembly module TamB domain-containing protein n=1 Tax=Ahrensia sp. R2A130 TaxID=744979 RepID=UPI0001E09447|nr:translocation/assembly module TamB domain-containing protein [Ahrensia sp. R2A130]EFL89578.1 gramicidin S biosynthesis GrsT protein [Ahrensia sp. R2A130]
MAKSPTIIVLASLGFGAVAGLAFAAMGPQARAPQIQTQQLQATPVQAAQPLQAEAQQTKEIQVAQNVAAETAEVTEDKGTFVRYVEDTLSSDNMKISLNGLEGTLSSDVQLTSITIADKEGVWLTIEQPRLIWNRSALLRGRVEIESLTAAKINLPRTPAPDESLPDVEAAPFQLPELPVSVTIEKLEIAEVVFGEPVFGLAATTSVAGNIRLADGSLEADLAIARLDGPGGQLGLKANYANEAQQLALDVTLSEPQDGIVASLMNLPGKPPVQFVVKGEGPLSDLDVDLAFDVDQRRILTGKLAIDTADGGRIIRADLNGPIASIMPERSRSFFGLETSLDATAILRDAGGVELRDLRITGGELDVSGSARTIASGALEALNLAIKLVPNGTDRVAIPGAEGVSIGLGNLDVTYDAANRDGFAARLTGERLKANDMDVADIMLETGGTVTNLANAAQRAIQFQLNSKLSGIATPDPALQEAVGTAIMLNGRGSKQGNAPLRISNMTVDGETFDVTADGQLDGATFDGTIDLMANRLAAFAAIAGRELAGQADLTATGKIEGASGGFNLRLDGTTTDLSLGIEAADKLLAGETTLAGRAARNETGITFDGLRVANRRFETTLDGRFSGESANLKARALLRDLADISTAGRGEVELTASVDGEQAPFAVQAQLAMPRGNLQGRTVENLALGFGGTASPEAVKGELDASGTLASQPVTLDGMIDATFGDDGAIRVDGLDAKVGETRLTGDILRRANGLIDGAVAVNSTDIGDVAALALTKASGSVNGNVKLESAAGKQNATADIKASNVMVDTIRVGSAEVDAIIEDLFGKPNINAKIDGRNIRAGGTDITSVAGDVSTQGDTTDFDLEARLAQNDAVIATTGSALREGANTTVRLEKLTVDSNITDARLSAPTTIRIAGSNVKLDGALLNVGGGTVRVTGSAGDSLDLNIGLDNLPLNIANAVSPQTRAGGTLSGTATVKGKPAAPNVNFDLRGNGVTAGAVADAGVDPIDVSASGTFDGKAVNLASLRATNPQGLSINGNGNIPLSGPGLGLRVEGTAPLSVVQGQLASRGASIDGTIRFDVTARGSLQNPQPSGVISLQNATLTDPVSNLKLTSINLIAGIDGQQVTIRTGSANLSAGGSVNISGSVGLNGDLPANLAIQLNNARYTDGATFDTSAAGRLTVTGALLADPLLAGTVNLGKTEITVPENIGGGGELLEVTHVSPPARVQRALAKIERAKPPRTPSSRPSVLRLDVTVNAPNQIFVRGRGLDAELGGRIRVTGPVTNVQPVGRFELRRGRLSILGQRIDLNEGEITLTGDLDPRLRLVAQTSTDDVTAFITLSGRVSDLDVTFTSDPELPQDEVLARIIFGRGLADLSPVQIVRLASIAAELTGGNSPGLVDGIRSGTGLDDLDVVQDEDGNAAVKAGKYVSDNVYLGVEAGQNSKATINLDITKDVTARGSVAADGETSLGIFLERDY